MRLIRLLLIPMVLISASLWVQAQQVNTFTLNEINNEVSPKATDNISDKAFFEINEEVFTHTDFKKGAVFTFNLTDNESKDFVVTKRLEYIPGKVSIMAREKEGSENVFMFTHSNGLLTGIYHETHDRSFNLGYDKEVAQNYIVQNSAENHDVQACALYETELDVPVSLFNDGKMERKGKSASNYTYSPAPVNASVDDSVTIDLLMAYSQKAEDWANSSGTVADIDAAISQAMLLAQAVLDNSKSGVELRLVHQYKTDYSDDDSGTEAGTHLRRFTQNPDTPVFETGEGYDGYMEEVHVLRAQYGADLAALLLSEPNTGGIAWRLNSTGGSPRLGFSVNRIEQNNLGYTLIHEIGHNIGHSHSRTQQQNEADESGGLFHYSAGYQDQANNFHTIMAYSDGLTEAPIFSSPDLTYNGFPAGTNSVRTPEDNARSTKEIKRTIAGYFPTIEQSPVAGVSSGNIEVNLNSDEEITIPIDITNSGESNLLWDVDFDFPASALSKQKNAAPKADEEALITEVEDRPNSMPANYTRKLDRERAKMATGEEVIYSTSFETDDGFERNGSYIGYNEWRSLSSTPYNITTQNPSTGNRNLRIQEETGAGTQFIAAPFFGYQQFGTYEVNFKVSVSSTSEAYFIRLYDGKTGDQSGGLTLQQGNIYMAYITEDGTLSYNTFGNGITVQEDVYYSIRIVYDNLQQVVSYYVDGNLAVENDYINGKTPSYFELIHVNGETDSYIDIDDVEIKQLAVPYPWLSLETMGGFTQEGESTQINLVFDANGMAAGTYETMMQVRTNDPDNVVIEVPVKLNVSETVSNELTDSPNKISLDQNYPNPFNPTTTIRYTLAQSQNVQLDVFNIQGQKVATLLQNERVGSGEHQVTFDASELSSGIYIYRLKTATHILTRQMVLIK